MFLMAYHLKAILSNSTANVQHGSEADVMRE